MHDLMYQFNKISGFGNAKEIVYCFKKAPHLSNEIDPAEPIFFKKSKFLLLSFSDKSNVSVE